MNGYTLLGWLIAAITFLMIIALHPWVGIALAFLLIFHKQILEVINDSDRHRK